MDERISKIKTCAYCREVIKPDEQVETCNGCNAVLHTQCWKDNSGCNTFGCRGKAVAVAPASIQQQPTGEINTSLPPVSRLPVAPHAAAPAERIAPQAPVWAANPAVPIEARILAYSFAFLMVLTALISFSSWRPVSVAEIPANWESPLASSLGYTIPYPNKWRVITRKDIIERQKGEVDTENIGDIFVLPQSNVQIHTIPIETPDPTFSLDDILLRKIIRGTFFDKSENADNFQMVSTRNRNSSADSIFEFTFQITEQHGENIFRYRTVAMHGAWTIHKNGTGQLIIIGVAPQEGWTAMSDIFSHMVGELRTQLQ